MGNLLTVHYLSTFSTDFVKFLKVILFTATTTWSDSPSLPPAVCPGLSTEVQNTTDGHFAITLTMLLDRWNDIV